MKIAVLGSGGMLGHLVGYFLKEKYASRVILSARALTGFSFLDDELEVLDLSDTERLKEFLGRHMPCVVINCAAVNDFQKGADVIDKINAQLPHHIVSILNAKNDGSRLIHISTDGVFRGDRGGYSEDDAPDSDDLYGRTKRAGEIFKHPHLTIRTSIVGPDPIGSRGLLHWFLSQQEAVQGFTRIFWSGVTTLELARFLDFAIDRSLSGLYHLPSERISKHDLLVLIGDVFGKKIVIHKEGKSFMDRSLVSRRDDVAYRVPGHRQMLQDLKKWMEHHPQLYGKYLLKG